jgi:hypothetical protein
MNTARQNGKMRVSTIELKQKYQDKIQVVVFKI